MISLKPFFCFYGGKWRAAPHYPKPKYDFIVEPFAGAAGYATRYHRYNVVLIEKDPVIAALWRYLIRVRSEEIFRLPLLGPNDRVDSLNICPEAKSLIGFWCNKGCVAPMKSPSAWMRAGTRPNSFWGSAIRERIAQGMFWSAKMLARLGFPFGLFVA